MSDLLPAKTDGPGALALPEAPSTRAPASPLGVFTRPTTKTGWRSWVTTIDHKKIGIMYGAAALVFFIIGGLEALLIRAQLWAPKQHLLSAEAYNQVFTMHGTTMVFLVVMPIGAAFANYLMPLQIGARDVAFPRINAFSFWCFLFGGIFLNTSWLLGGGADGGWFMYAPNSGLLYSPTHGIDFWNLGLIITGVASLTGAVNLIVTVLNLRAPGMSLMKMPVFTWMTLVTQFLLLFAIPVLTAAQFLLLFDRQFGANFFNVAEGANPLLWEHLFWVFGHPEVYLMILPAFGLVSDMLPVFSRKPIFGYPFIVFSGIAIGFMGWGVWAHHMFVSGIGPVSVTVFSLTTMFIAVPTGVKILNWTATMWGGKLRFDTPLLFCCGLITMFTIGGLSGVTHAVAPADTQQTDTYYIVAHFHYVLFGGSIFGIFAGFYYWWPKIFGRTLSEKLGKVHFWMWLFGFNLTFGPMHILGIQGMPRRTATYQPGMGWDLMNVLSTIGSYTIALGFLVFVYNMIKSRDNVCHDPDPWDGRTLEWATSSPPPEHNFDIEPTVSSLDEWWHRKYEVGDDHRLRRRSDVEFLVTDTPPPNIHLPSPSYWPILLAVGLPLISYGLMYSYWLSGLGGIIVLAAIYGWALEPSVDPDAGHDHHAVEAHPTEPGEAGEPVEGDGDDQAELVGAGVGGDGEEQS
jgi:cytochrome c oxidase subunit I